MFIAEKLLDALFLKTSIFSLSYFDFIMLERMSHPVELKFGIHSKSNAVCIGNRGLQFRFEYKYEIEYENDFSILVCRLHIVTSHTYLIP